MKLPTAQLGAAPVKLISTITILVLAIAGGIFVLDQGEVEAKFASAPTVINSGSTYHYIYTVSKAKFGKETPLPGRSYSFRVEPGEDEVSLSPATGVSDSTGNIDISVTPKPDFTGRVSIWVKDNLTGLEHAAVHVVVKRNS